MRIAEEGLHVVFVLLAVTVTLFFFSVVTGIVASIFFLFSLYFFRDPERKLPSLSATAVISPADGKIIGIQEVQEEKFLKEKRLKLSIFMSLFDVHVNRSPIDGVVKGIEHVPGRKEPAYKEDSSEVNERNYLVLEKEGLSLLIVQVAGIVARRIRCHVKVGDFLTRGERFGMIMFGSRVDVYLPLSAEVKVVMGEKVRAGETVLAELDAKGVSGDEDKKS
ncbi:MAG: phosphatidylserine decarboxylase family protein [Synergistetes bacterium]|nr:phosphatidylserine decarboxylase family protein [Synergistota bacterium]